MSQYKYDCSRSDNIIKEIKQFILSMQDIDEKITFINNLRKTVHELSPFKNEPVDLVLWVKNSAVVANDYNPNSVAPPEMKLLEHSIMEDGYTQPIVSMPREDGTKEVVDGFHRHRVGKESKIINSRVQGYLPVVLIRTEQFDRNKRIASTIRHNRARGKHKVDAMSEIVLELKNRNWKNERIARELGMDEDEILRLCQISGLEDIFKDEDFSKAWLIQDSTDDFEPLTDEITEQEKEQNNFRTVNTGDEERIFHTFDKWECHKAGFYNSTVEGYSQEQCELEYAKMLTDIKTFSRALERVITEWKYSCEHYLTNGSMNRIAWLGQAALCIEKNIPSKYRGGFNLLSEAQKEKANKTAFRFLNKWRKKNGLKALSFEDAMAVGRQVETY